MGSFFLDSDDVRSLSLRAVQNFSKVRGLPLLGIRVWGTTGLSKGPGAMGMKGLEMNHYCLLFYSMQSYHTIKCQTQCLGIHKTHIVKCVPLINTGTLTLTSENRQNIALSAGNIHNSQQYMHTLSSSCFIQPTAEFLQ